jgi:hypothetical protein
MKVKKISESKPSAWIVSSKDRGRKPVKKTNVYLEDKEEFLIEVFNPLQKSVLVDIRLNGSSISKTGLLVKPAQRIYLDCFIDTKKKFVFSTYEVDSNTENEWSISKNGLVEVFFYKEETMSIENWLDTFHQKTITKYYPIYVDRWVYPYYHPHPCYPNPIIYSGGTNIGTIYGQNQNYVTGNTNILNNSQSIYTTNSVGYNSTQIETGRIEGFGKSEQKFEEVQDMNFEKNFISSVVYRILPESRKPVEIKKIKQESKNWSEILKDLYELHKSGILTDSEYSSKKSEILSKI